MSRTCGLLALALSAALFVACNKGGDTPGAPGGGATALTGSGGVTALDLIPKDATVVFGMNWSKFKGTKFFNLMISNLPPDAKTKLEEVKAVCSLDPMNDLDSIVVGVMGNMDKTSKVVVVVKGNWNEDKVAKCATAISEKDGKKVTIVKTGNLTTITPPNDKAMTMGWAGDLAVFTSTSGDADKTYITEIMKHATTVKDNKPVMDLLGKTDQGATMYGAFLTPPGSEIASSTNKVTGGTEKLAGAYGTIKLASDLDMNFGMRFGTDADAKAVADKLNKELENAKSSPQGQLLTNATITTSGSDAVVAVKLDEKQLDTITEQLKAIAPMLMGGMMGGMGGQ